MILVKLVTIFTERVLKKAKNFILLQDNFVLPLHCQPQLSVLTLEFLHADVNIKMLVLVELVH